MAPLFITCVLEFIVVEPEYRIETFDNTCDVSEKNERHLFACMEGCIPDLNHNSLDYVVDNYRCHVHDYCTTSRVLGCAS